MVDNVGFGALAQTTGTTAIPLLRKYIVPTPKCMGVHLLDFAVPDIEDVYSGRVISRQLQRVWEDKLSENSWVVVAAKEVQAESFQQNLQNEPVGREETFLETILINHAV